MKLLYTAGVVPGGGVRLIIALYMMTFIEEHARKSTKNENLFLSDLLKIAGGTSAGSIWAALTVTRKEDGSKYSQREILELVIEHEPGIFSSGFWKFFRSFFDEKHKSDYFKKMLTKYLGKNTNFDAVIPYIITAFDAENVEPIYFAKEDHRQFEMKEQVHGSTAAPTFLEAALIDDQSGTRFTLVDGGITFDNDPSWTTKAYLRYLYSTEEYRVTEKDIFLFTLGTGREEKKYKYKRIMSWGKIGWLKPLISMMLIGNKRGTKRNLALEFAADGAEDQYINIDPSLGMASRVLDRATKGNIRELKQAGARAVHKYRKDLVYITEKLVENHAAWTKEKTS